MLVFHSSFDSQFNHRLLDVHAVHDTDDYSYNEIYLGPTVV